MRYRFQILIATIMALSMISLVQAAGGILSPGGGGLLTPLYINFTNDGTGIIPFNNLNFGSLSQKVANGYFNNLFASSTLGIGTSSPYSQLSIASNSTVDTVPSFIIDGVNGGYNSDMDLNRGANTGTEEANIDFSTAGLLNYQLGIQNNGTSDFELWDGTNGPIFTVKSSSDAIGFGTTSPFGDFAIDADYGDVGSVIFNVASSSATATSSIFTVNNNGGISVGTSSQSTLVNIGPKTANGTTTISEGKIQFDGYNSAGTRVCMYLNASNILTVTAGACANP